MVHGATRELANDPMFSEMVIGVVAAQLHGDVGVSAAARFAADQLDADLGELDSTSYRLSALVGELAAYVLDREATASVLVRDADRHAERPTVRTLELSHATVRFAGPTISVREVPGGGRCVLQLREASSSAWWLHLWAPTEHATASQRYVQDLLGRARGSENPLRGCHLVATEMDRVFHLRAEPYPTATRAELRMDDDVWSAVDRCVHRHFTRTDALRRLGFGQRRGLLVHGPPGTGKTHLGRVIAAEVAGKATTIVVDQQAMVDHIEKVYEFAVDLAPTVVFLEDVDIIASARGGASHGVLRALLNVMDGPLTPDGPVVTVATTNDLRTMDEAAIRSGRFDQIVEASRPDAEARRMIVERYAAGLEDGGDVDAQRVALATTGATGADLRELFRRALLDTDGVITTDTLLGLLSGPGPAAGVPTPYL